MAREAYPVNCDGPSVGMAAYARDGEFLEVLTGTLFGPGTNLWLLARADGLIPWGGVFLITPPLDGSVSGLAMAS
jgi:hypothetical protein